MVAMHNFVFLCKFRWSQSADTLTNRKFYRIANFGEVHPSDPSPDTFAALFACTSATSFQICPNNLAFI